MVFTFIIYLFQFEIFPLHFQLLHFYCLPHVLPIKPTIASLVLEKIQELRELLLSQSFFLD